MCQIHMQKTVTSVAAVRRTRNIAARARGARERYSVSRVSFGAEIRRPPMCVMPSMPSKLEHRQTLLIQRLRHQSQKD